MKVVTREIEIVNRLGLHARAAARVAKLSEHFRCLIKIEKDGMSADGKSVMGMLLLCGQMGTRLRVTAEGDDAEEAVAAIAELVGDRFGEAR